MNGTYALVETTTGLVVNTIVLAEPVTWTPPEGFFVIQTDVASTGWSYVDGVFSPPPVPPLTPEEILYKNKAEKDQRVNYASQAMAPVLVSLQLGDATDDETTTAKAWQTYYRALVEVDLSVCQPAWPDLPVLT